MKRIYFPLLIIIAVFSAASSDTLSTEPIEVEAMRVKEPIVVDGILTESVWHNGCELCDFSQREPDEGAEATEKTVLRIAYDDEALYVGARMYDSAPDSIITRMGRHDEWVSADFVRFYIDPYYDRRSGFYFGLNAAGTRDDGILYNDEWSDDSWDGVWEGKVNIDDKGWTAEMRIPYSQLRFQKKDIYKWGVNFRRCIERKHEHDYIVFTPRDGSGFVSRFIDLVGIQNVTAARQVEVLPYSRFKAEYIPSEPDDPFNDGSRYQPDVGADLKIGIGNNLTLDATVNPDFGQVEVDPAVINLGDVETFYNEKRPFFIEGSSIFDFGYGGSRSNWSFNWGGPDLFYSRRIGRHPVGSLPDEYDYAQILEGTRILGAAKLTGKVGDNWNVGMLHAMTSREKAKVATSGEEYRWEVEPFSYYGLARAQKEMNEGKQGLGFMSTLTTRMFQDDRLRDEINSGAGAFGIDGWTFLDSDKKWVISGWTAASHVRGNKSRMLDLQQNSQHYFQRPDASHVDVDSTATSMTGFAGRVSLNKQKGNIILNTAVGVIDPGFDVNDMGFMWRTDVINGHLGCGYKWTKPGKLTRYTEVLGAVFQNYDFGGHNTWRGVWQSCYMEFLNYYEFNYSFALNPKTLSSTRTRGGPLLENPPGWEVNCWFNTDERQKWVFGCGTWGYSRGTSNWDRGLETWVEWKPGSNVSVSLDPQIWWNKENAQWVDWYDDPTATDTYGRRYVFAQMNQTELSASIRLNWTFSPRLSLQFYGQPLLSSGDYRNFKELARPESYDFNRYEYGELNEDGEYIIDPDGPEGPAESFALGNPDFSYASLRGSAVLRWEYNPGSVFYLVWTHNKFDYEEIGDFHFRHSMKRLWDAEADNILMAKLSYWLSI